MGHPVKYFLIHRSTEQDNTARNQCQKGAPRWKVMAGKAAQGALGTKTGNTTWSRNSRNQREKIVFRPIPKRLPQVTFNPVYDFHKLEGNMIHIEPVV